MAAPKTILLVEDEPAVREVAHDMLADNGYRVVTASGAEDALRLIREGGIDMMVTDVIMPGLNGFELAHRAKAVRPSLPILYISGYHDQARLEAQAIHGPILRKPFRTGDLLEKVAAILR